MIETDLLETVIGLGPNLFYGTGIPACLLILRKNKEKDRVGSVQIIDGSKRFQPGRNQNSINDDDVDALYDAYCDIEAEPENVKQALIEHADIEANGWDLNIGRYIEQQAAEIINVTIALATMTLAEEGSASAQAAMHERLKAAGYA